jgi:hypothetical protein
MNDAELASVPPAPFTDQLRLAEVAYLARFMGSTRNPTESDLHCFLATHLGLAVTSVYSSTGTLFSASTRL